MKKKFLLFISSFFFSFLYLGIFELFIELIRFNPLLIQASDVLSFVFIGIFFGLAIFSLWIAHLFKTTYSIADPIRNQKEIYVVELRNATTEVVGYFLSVLLPAFEYSLLAGLDTHDYIRFFLNVMIYTILGFIYSKSNLIVVNPTLMLCHIYLYVIKYKSNLDDNVSFEGVLISKEQIKDKGFQTRINVEELDDFLFYLR